MALAKRNGSPSPLILQNKERHFSLSILAKLLPDKPHYRTLVRWCTRGSKSDGGGIVRMESIRGSGLSKRYLRSSVEAFHRFIERINGE